MSQPRTEAPLATKGARGYRDLHEHLEELKKRGLLLTIARPVDKDSELHPLVRWQFVGGMDEAERKAFLFTNIVDGRGRKYDIPVVVGAIAANRAIYSAGMGAPLSEIQAKWDRAIAHPIPPREIEHAACHEIVHEGEALQGEGRGLDRLPIPISTPGFDSAPTLTATNVITRDPETGVQNMGTYRAALKSSDRLVVRMATRVGGAGGYLHYVKYQKLGKKTMPCAIVLGCPPYVAFMGPQKLPVGVDEFTVAGGLAGSPINVVRTVREYERAGVAAIQLEDQVFPKRCGHLAGKDVIGVDQFGLALQAAVEARRDPDTVIIARTDARAPLGIEEAISRSACFKASLVSF